MRGQISVVFPMPFTLPYIYRNHFESLHIRNIHQFHHVNGSLMNAVPIQLLPSLCRQMTLVAARIPIIIVPNALIHTSAPFPHSPTIWQPLAIPMSLPERSTLSQQYLRGNSNKMASVSERERGREIGRRRGSFDSLTQPPPLGVSMIAGEKGMRSVGTVAKIISWCGKIYRAS